VARSDVRRAGPRDLCVSSGARHRFVVRSKKPVSACSARIRNTLENSVAEFVGFTKWRRNRRHGRAAPSPDRSARDRSRSGCVRGARLMVCEMEGTMAEDDYSFMRVRAMDYAAKSDPFTLRGRLVIEDAFIAGYELRKRIALKIEEPPK